MMRAIVTGVALVVLAGCAGAPLEAGDTDPWVAELEGGAMDALLTFTLRRTDTPSCWVAEQGAETSLAIAWPPGTRSVATAGQVAIELDDGRTFVAGDEVEVAGGFVPSGGSLARSAPAACPTDDGVLVIAPTE